MIKKDSRHLEWKAGIMIFWIAFFLIIALIVSIISALVSSYQLPLGIFLLLFGILGTLFNKKMHKHIILKYNVWFYQIIGAKEMEKAMKSNWYEKLYRIVLFFVGLVLLYVGASIILSHLGVNSEFLF